MSRQQQFDELFDSAMRQDPGYVLPSSFMQGVNDRIARKLAFRIQVKTMIQSAIILALITGGTFAANYIIGRFFPKYAEFSINGYAVAGIAILVLFLLFMDKIVLGYLENRRQNHT